MSIKDEIIELEKKAKEAELWKERYEELRDKVNSIITDLQSLTTIKINKRVIRLKSNDLQSKLNKVIEEIYVNLKSEKIYEAGTEYITKMLESNGLSTGTQNLQLVRDSLRKKDGIDERRDKMKLLFFYTGAREVKYGNVSKMG